MERINKIIELHQSDPFNFGKIFLLYKTLRGCLSKEQAYTNIFHNIFAKAYVGYTTMAEHYQVVKKNSLNKQQKNTDTE